MAKGGGVCVVKGGMHGEGGACMVKGGHVCQRGGVWQRGVCMAKGGMHGKGGACVVCTPPLYEIRPVNARAVRILLECILVIIV